MQESLLAPREPQIRTQILLGRTLKRALEIKRRILDESLSEYLRRAAVLRLLVESEEKGELAKVARNFIGAAKWKKNHPHWPNKAKARRWLQTIRREWEQNETLSSRH